MNIFELLTYCFSPIDYQKTHFDSKFHYLSSLDWCDRNQRKIREYIIDQKLVNLSVPQSIRRIVSIIENHEVLQDAHITSVCNELQSLDPIHHDLWIRLLNELRDKLFRLCAREIKEASRSIEKALLNGQSIPTDASHSLTYTILLNYQKLYSFNQRFISLNNPMYDRHHVENEWKTAMQVALGINSFHLLSKLPEQDYLNVLSFLKSFPMVQEIYVYLEQNNKLKLDNGFIFSFSNTMKNYYFLATDGEKIIYALKEDDHLFSASHNYKNFSYIESDKFTSKQRTSYSDSDQNFWNSFSKNVIDEGASLLKSDPDFKNLKNILLFLGEKRQICAQRLHHRAEENRTGDFGKPRSQYNSARGYPCESVFKTGIWSDLFFNINERLNQALNDNPAYFSNKSYSKDDYKYPSPEIKDHDGFQIHFAKNFKKPIEFMYPCIPDEAAYNSRLHELQGAYDALINWDGDNVNEFIRNVGCLSYSLYRLLPLTLGTSACVNWLMHAVARYHGVDLGPMQDRKNDLSLDWEAFLTFNKKQYADWFLKHAYQNVTFLKPNDCATDIGTLHPESVSEVKQQDTQKSDISLKSISSLSTYSFLKPEIEKTVDEPSMGVGWVV